MKLTIPVVLVLFVTLASSEYFEYEGYKLYETIPKNRSQSDLLRQLSELSDEFDFWKLSKLSHDSAHVMISPRYQKDFEDIITRSGMILNILNHDVSQAIRQERIENYQMRTRNSLSSSVSFSKFHRHSEINEYLDELAQRFSERVKVTEIGRSYENRPVKTITITNGNGRTDKKVIFVDAGIHAREWIAPATALYVIYELVENFQQNMNLLEDIDWIILPVVNPDGYEYTHVSERFWRKTRKPNSKCTGTDGNRNFAFHWGEEGASPEQCSETYQGPTAFSEPETQIVRNILLSLRGRCKFYLTLHSYGKYLLYPWGFTSDLPDNWKDLDEVSRAGANAIKSFNGSRYTVGSSTNVLYASAGGSDDYAMGGAGIPVAITMELPGGGSGFDPYPSQILSMVTESWVGIKAMAVKIHDKYL